MSEANKDSSNSETLLKFPCDFPIKIFGKKHDDLRNEVLNIIHNEVPDFDEKNLTIKESKDGNYHALTAMIHATSKAQLDAIYHALSNHHLVTMAL
jgi:putative lipoic acid-binding regulatory protein